MTKTLTTSTTSDPSPIHPADPAPSWVAGFVAPVLYKSAAYRIDTSQAHIKLDQNESPWDLPQALKARICQRLAEAAWHRYPSAYSDDLAEKVAKHAGVSAHSVLLGPGSNYLISLMLSTFTTHLMRPPGRDQDGSAAPVLKIAQPSFPHYESHCKYEGIPYEVWPLSKDLEFDISGLKDLPPHSLVIFATPNNPVGNILRPGDLELILKQNPQSLFIADEAYYEFQDHSLAPLLARNSNLLLVRTFSKTLAAAGVRLGYVLGSARYIEQLRKVRQPFILNVFQNICLEEILADDSSEIEGHLGRVISHTKRENEQLSDTFARLGPLKGFTFKKSAANFFLLRWTPPAFALQVYQHLLSHGIQVRNVSQSPGLAGCLRMTIGTEAENQAFSSALEKWHPQA